MRKLIISLFSLLTLGQSPYVYAQSPNSGAIPLIITHQDQLMDISADAIIYNNHIMVPFQQFFEAFGAEVGWNTNEKAATATKDGVSIKIAQSGLTAWVNEAEYELAQAPFLHKGSLYVSLRFAATALGLNLEYTPNPVTVTLLPSNPTIDKPDIERITKSVVEHKQAIEQTNAIEIILFEYTDERFWVEIRSYGDIERMVSSADVQKIRETIFQAAGTTFPLKVAVKECCTRNADITGTVKEVDADKNRMLISNEDKSSIWITLAEDGKWFTKEQDNSALPFNDSLIGKRASAWTYGITQLTDPAHSVAVKIRIE